MFFLFFIFIFYCFCFITLLFLQFLFDYNNPFSLHTYNNKLISCGDLDLTTSASESPRKAYLLKPINNLKSANSDKYVSNKQQQISEK
jgi:hypothetical protein